MCSSEGKCHPKIIKAQKKNFVKSKAKGAPCRSTMPPKIQSSTRQTAICGSWAITAAMMVVTTISGIIYIPL